MLRYKVILLSLCSLLFLACENDDFTIGKGWVDVNTRAIVIDTCTVDLSTVMIDSVATSGKAIALIGEYTDPSAGKITASSFFELGIPSEDSRKNVTIHSVFDSLTFKIIPNSQYFGDTLQRQRYRIHQLNQPLTFNKGNLYNTSEVGVNATPLASAGFNSTPKRTLPPIEIRLPDNLGNELFTKFKDNSSDVTVLDNFIQYFKGLAIVPDINSASIMGFSVADSIFSMNLYFHNVNEHDVKVSKKLIFSVNSNKQFNQILADRTSTPLSVLNSVDFHVSSIHTNNEAYVESGSCLFTRITFPYLNNLLSIGKYGKITDAELIIHPVQNTYGPATPLPSVLYLYEASIADQSLSVIVDGNNQTQTGNLKIDYYMQEKTYYKYNITSFLNSQLGVATAQRRGLQLVIPNTEIGSSVKRVVIGDQHNSVKPNRVELKITYASYNGKD